MDNYQKFGLISGQATLGLLFGFIAAIATTVLLSLLGEFDLFGINPVVIFLIAIVGYAFMQIGIGYYGYIFLKEMQKLEIFKRLLTQSVIGLFTGAAIGIIGLYCEVALSFFMPMVGSIMGFSIGIKKRFNSNDN